MRLPIQIVLLSAIVFVSGVRAAEEAIGEPVADKVVHDVVYGYKDGLALTFDVITPLKDAKGLGVILISSGGWRSDKSNIAEENDSRRKREHWIQGLLKGGYTIFLMRHGSGTRYHVPEMVDDIRRGVRFVRAHAAEYGVDPNHIGITSGSSGGHLSLMVGLTGDDGNPDAKDPIEKVSSRTQAVVAWFPPTDLINWGKEGGYKNIAKLRPGFLESLFGKVDDIEGQLKSISPIEFVTPDDPPVLLIHGDRDITVPLQQSQVFKSKYEGANLPVKLVVHPKGGHTYWPGIMDDYPAVWEWFDKYLKP